MCYVNAKIKEAARKFGCDYGPFERLVREENEAFYIAIKSLYSAYQRYEKGHPDLINAYKLFKLPVAEGFSYTENETEVFSDVTTQQLSAIFTTIIEQMVPEDKQEEFKKYFNI